MSQILLVAISITTFYLIYIRINEEYMDEPFHIPQAQRYCKYDFTWDPKITTPPGLYYISFMLNPLIGCSFPALRLTNLGLSFLKFYVLGLLSNDPLWLYFMPISFLYNHLYYTDNLSELLLLLSFYGVKRGSKPEIYVFGFLSIFVRQTNFVLYIWLVFWGIYERNKYLNPLLNIPLYQLNLKKSFQIIVMFVHVVFTKSLVDISLVCLSISYLGYLVSKFGIVQGDKENHQLSFHFAQMLYFGCTLVGVFAIFDLNIFTKIRIKRFLALWVIIFFIVKFFTIHHIFLLSDNRHLTFYFWKAFYSNLTIFHEITYAMVYTIVWYIILTYLSNFPLIPVLGYIVSLLLILVPSPLFEIRYYIFHLTVFGIVFHKFDKKSKAMTIILNTFVLGLFIFHPNHIMW
eukprot:NODE_254_length_11700_cov_0.671580.p3 type:complete len:403 gc:universal NODE_254_length_11700_cov_0.671580:8801-10009(+)